MSKYFSVPINLNNLNQRTREPVATSGFRFPTTKELAMAAVELGKDIFNQENVLINQLFPNDTTLASEIEVTLLRNQPGESGGMTLIHAPNANVLPIEVRGQRFDLARQSWSPIHFKESKTWEENEMLYLGNLTEEVATSQFEGQVTEYVAWMLQRMENRRRWMIWQVLQTGKLVIDDTDPYNPNRIISTIDYGLTDMQITLSELFDETEGTGLDRRSKVDPVEVFNNMQRAARWKPEIMPHTIIVNSHFVEVLTDNTFMQYRVDYRNGWTAIEMRPPRSVYRTAVLDIFKAETGLNVVLDDSTYKDENGNVQYWIPNGKMVILNQHDGPVGNFVFAGHVAGISESGAIQIGTGPYIQVDDRSRIDPPKYSILGGFVGLPRISTGYNPVNFENHRIKWMTYADADDIDDNYGIPFPTDEELRPLGDVPSITGR